MSFGALGALTLAALTLGACSAQGSHVVQGRLYVEERDCVDELVAVDVAEGPDPGLGCDAICMSGNSPLVGDGGVALYVTTQCPPYPGLFDLAQDSPACVKALAASLRKDRCTDAGSSNPLDAGVFDAAVDDSPSDASSRDADD